jgi:hypothetical protein
MTGMPKHQGTCAVATKLRLRSIANLSKSRSQQRTAYCSLTLKTLLLYEKAELSLKEVKAKTVANDVNERLARPRSQTRRF